MSVALRHDLPTMAPGEFLEWEAAQDLRYEFDGLQPCAMTGGTVLHSLIGRNLAIAIGGRLRGKPCVFHGNDLKIETSPGGKYRYPDGFVMCTPVTPTATFVHDPIVIFEVLSASTAGVDRIVKNAEYAAMPSVRRYVMLEQDRIAATVFERAGEDWVGHLLSADATLSMPEIEVELPLAELYEGVAFEGAEG